MGKLNRKKLKLKLTAEQKTRLQEKREIGEYLVAKHAQEILESPDPILRIAREVAKLGSDVFNLKLNGSDLASTVVRLDSRVQAWDMREKLVQEEEEMKKKIVQKKLSLVEAWT